MLPCYISHDKHFPRHCIKDHIHRRLDVAACKHSTMRRLATLHCLPAQGLKVDSTSPRMSAVSATPLWFTSIFFTVKKLNHSKTKNQSPICSDTNVFPMTWKNTITKYNPNIPALFQIAPPSALSWQTQSKTYISRYILLDRIVYVNGASNLVLLSIFKTLSFEAHSGRKTAVPSPCFSIACIVWYCIVAFNVFNRKRNHIVRL